MSLEKWNMNSIRVAVAIIATLWMGLAPSLMADRSDKRDVANHPGADPHILRRQNGECPVRFVDCRTLKAGSL